MAMEKTFNAAEAESRLYEKWEEAGAFKAGANAKPGAETFSIMIPPPNVTGSLHMGHAFNNTLQDILVRWHRMRGFDTLWQPGQDHAGIATQMVVERKLAAENQPSRAELGREKFLEKVWEWKEQSGDTIINQLKRLGATCDWSRNAFTMDDNFQHAVRKVFVDMYNKGLIYKGKRLVNWDPHFETAISDLEVENIEVAGHMWHFKYPLAGGETYEYVEKDEDGNVTLSETRDYISIATTRPETMLGDGAVAVHPDDARYAPIVGKLCEIPVGPKEQRRLIPIITDEYPDMNFGSGAVKITGAHDFNDYQVAKRNDIPLYSLMDTKGAMRADGLAYADAAAQAQAIAEGGEAPADVTEINLVPEEYRGLDRFEARKKVIADITAEGLAVMTTETTKDEDGNEQEVQVPFVENKPVMQPFGDRSKVVIEPMLTDQWFVDTAQIVEPALEAVRNGDTQILPEANAKVYFHWLENIEPWCISRQLWWGHQVPVWYDDEGNEYCAATEEEAIELAGGKSLTRDPDVLDTWFSSGLWPIGTLGWPNDTEELKKYFPTDVLITGFDIIFFWVARMMMMQLSVVDQIPFHTVYVHALVRDEKGKKMSKSVGNVIDPLDTIDEFGADAVRFTLTAMAAMGRDLKLSTSRIQGYRNFGTKLWNAARFAEMNDCVPSKDFDPTAVKQTVNRWIIGEAAKARVEFDASLANYRFNDAANGLYFFTWGKVCDWFVEFAKPLLNSDDAEIVAETRATMAWVIDQCLVLLHPIMPFITEELWGSITARDKMLIHADWPTYGEDLIDEDADREMNWVIGLIEGIRSIRAEMRVPAGAKLPMLQIELDAKYQDALSRNEALILKLARIESIAAVDALPKGCVTIAVPGGTFALPIADIIDLEAEEARLTKALGKVEKEFGGLNGRLNNPKFVASAPEAVVEESRARLAELEEEATKLKAAKQRLAELA
ncbi:valine--tRNA ligase [Halocynthiibacter sp. C4]|uniref:valine--tRNA ligase n=1 Tax=Halocynthiibacter sp. C4 TaxID=2992758 RepID=UPI00237AAAEF|nr:valine--tRNA ligase [Halocynthiibacter sp. C4]MDE0588970.1 valine--tRNA ligase [Halocynthiibacter sp. C4]